MLFERSKANLKQLPGPSERPSANSTIMSQTTFRSQPAPRLPKTTCRSQRAPRWHCNDLVLDDFPVPASAQVAQDDFPVRASAEVSLQRSCPRRLSGPRTLMKRALAHSGAVWRDLPSATPRSGSDPSGSGSAPSRVGTNPEGSWTSQAEGVREGGKEGGREGGSEGGRVTFDKN